MNAQLVQRNHQHIVHSFPHGCCPQYDMNGTQNSQNYLSVGRADSPVFSDLGTQDDDHLGDYSTRLEELMSDDELSNGRDQADDDEEEEEGFFYTGVDAESSGTYREQLRDVLGPEHEDDDDSDAPDVDQAVLRDVQEKEIFEANMDDEARVSSYTPLQHCSLRYASYSPQMSPQTYRPPPRRQRQRPGTLPLRRSSSLLVPVRRRKQ